MRRFDTDQHDPATTASEIQEFSCRLRILFIEGWVVCKPGSGQPPSTEPGGPDPIAATQGQLQTMTMIAMSQCADMIEFHYGDKVKCLWSRTSRQDCEKSLAVRSSDRLCPPAATSLGSAPSLLPCDAFWYVVC